MRMRLGLATMALLVRGGAGLVGLGRPVALARLGAFGVRHGHKVPSRWSPTASMMSTSTAAAADVEMPPVSLLAGFLGTGKSECRPPVVSRLVD